MRRCTPSKGVPPPPALPADRLFWPPGQPARCALSCADGRAVNRAPGGRSARQDLHSEKDLQGSLPVDFTRGASRREGPPFISSIDDGLPVRSTDGERAA